MGEFTLLGQTTGGQVLEHCTVSFPGKRSDALTKRYKENGGLGNATQLIFFKTVEV